jgi:hypothetical protein
VVKLFHSKPPTTPPPISTRSTTPPPTATTLVAITTTPPPPPQDLIAVVAWPTAVATSLHHYRYHLVLLTQLALLATNTMDKGIYHERQSLAFCALHAINNLLQYRAFTKTLLDDISHSLAPCQNINPHRSFLYDPARACNQGHLPCAIGNLIGIVIGGHRFSGIGFYDINVIHAALALHGLRFKWFDRRKELCSLPLDKLAGLIVNRTVSRFFVTSRHWFSIIPHPMSVEARANDCFDADLTHVFLNVDSLLPKPQTFDNKLQVCGTSASSPLLPSSARSDPSLALLLWCCWCCCVVDGCKP